jgi:multisubunit Na+/H+ antiporter MnhG subunit
MNYGVKMVNFGFVTSKIKTIVGVISLILGLLVFFITPSYIEFYLIIPFIIFAIFLIIPKDSIQNSKPLGAILIIFAAIVIYFTINGILNTYDVLTNLYLAGKFTTLPTASDISACSTGYGIVLAYAILNIIFGGLFFIPTSEDLY